MKAAQTHQGPKNKACLESVGFKVLHKSLWAVVLVLDPSVEPEPSCKRQFQLLF